MSFKVDWSLLENESMSEWTKELLTETLNSGKRPNILASNIEIKDLNFGKISPNFEILEIGELEKDRFRGIFKINYLGDAHITLHTKVQANPLKIYNDNLVELENYIGSSSNFINPNFLLSNEEFSIPLDLKLSDIKINGIGIIVFSKTKGLTLVFRNDPLESIKVSSTFDMVQVLANFLQKQIESQIRELFRETLPTVLHRLSLKYISLNDETNLKIFQTNRDHSHSEDGENEVILFDLTNELNHYSVENLQKNLKLFNSRETLNLHIPKFKNLIQRCNLDKFNQNLSPNLLTSLNLLNDNINDGNRTPSGMNGNGIPINLLVNKDYNNVQDIVKNISNIQSNNFYKNVNNNNLNIKPKRRVIRLNKKTRSDSPSSSIMSTSMSTINSVQSSPVLLSKSVSLNKCKSRALSMHDPNDSMMEVSSSDDSTLIDEAEKEDDLRQPKPLRLTLKPIHSHSHFHRNFSDNSPVNSNSSVLSGVGLGNNYFNFTNQEYIDNFDEINPFIAQKKPEVGENLGQKEPEKTSRTEEKEDDLVLDFKSIKDRLTELKKLEDDNHKHFYMEMPPPYQV